MEPQTKSKAVSSFRMKEMSDKIVATDFEYIVKQIKAVKDAKPINQIQNNTSQGACYFERESTAIAD